MTLGNNEKKMLTAMRIKQNHVWLLEELLEATQWNDQVHVAGSGKALADEGLVELIETHDENISLGSEGKKAAINGLLEFRLWSWILQQTESNRTMKGLFESGFERYEVGPGVGLLKSLGISIEKGIFVFEEEEEITKRILENFDT